MRRLLTHISTPKQSAAFAALAGITGLCLAVLALVVALGDQRSFEIVLATPVDGDSAPTTLRAITITFNVEPLREHVESHLQFAPAIAGTPRWRGKTLEYLLGEPLSPGSYTVTINQGALGRAAEQLHEPFELHFVVREPGVLLIVEDSDEQRLIEVRDGDAPRNLAAGSRIWDFAVSPDASTVAVIAGAPTGGTVLSLIDVASGRQSVIVDAPNIEASSVAWSPDSLALVVVRREVRADGNRSVPQAWLVRLNGEFVTPIDREGEPSLSPAWSPNAQSIAYVAPATGRLAVRNLATQEVLDLGQPRSSRIAWSPNSTMVVFDGVPVEEGVSNPAQPIRVVSLDGAVDLTLGAVGESRSQSRFLSDSVVMSLRRPVGTAPTGTQLLFESVPQGDRLRAITLTAGTALIQSWDLDPAQERIVYTVQEGATLTTIVMDLESGGRVVLGAAGSDATWLP